MSPQNKASRPESRNAVSGHPPCPLIAATADWYRVSTSGRSSRSTFTATNFVVDNLRGRRILIALAVHHMTPVAPHRANIQQHRLILSLGLLQTPPPPTHSTQSADAAPTANKPKPPGSKNSTPHPASPSHHSSHQSNRQPSAPPQSPPFSPIAGPMVESPAVSPIAGPMVESPAVSANGAPHHSLGRRPRSLRITIPRAEGPTQPQPTKRPAFPTPCPYFTAVGYHPSRSACISFSASTFRYTICPAG